MTGNQWFQLWLAIGQVVGGLLAVLIAARLAFAFARRQRTEDRSRLAAEKLAFALGSSIEQFLNFAGMIKFVIVPPPESLEATIARGADPAVTDHEARTAFGVVFSEAALLASKNLRERVHWAQLCLIDFSLMSAAIRSDPHRFTMIELADAAGEAAGVLVQIRSSLHQYTRGEALQPMSRPTYWRSPVDEAAFMLGRDKQQAEPNQ
jgi:hypothetical protein